MYVGRIEKLLCYYTPLPMCVVNGQGKVTRASAGIGEVFKYDGIMDYDIFALTGIKYAEFQEIAKTGKPLFIQRNDRTFKIVCGFLGDESEIQDEEITLSIVIYFLDVTSHEELKELYKSERVCICVINVDNFDELTAVSSEDKEMEVTAQVDKLIRSWATEMSAYIVRSKDNQYEIAMNYSSFEMLEKDNFKILEQAKEIETEADFPLTLSIGIGLGGKTLAETDRYAQDALDMALGRGGDQAVVKNVRKFSYYGGGTKSVEKRNKGKSRIIGHALKTLMVQSSKVFITGHRNPDMDSLGASLGIHRLAKVTEKETYIVLGEYNESMKDIVADARATGDYEFISEERALNLADENSLVVVVDVHRPSMIEASELAQSTEKLVVIDHHRKAADVICGQTISYIESYASSASELVTEILQYTLEKKTLSKMEADALLAGITLDTNRFAVKAGVRTFEAASWLKRAGAELQNVRRYFQDNAESFRIKAAGIANARLLEGGVAMSVCEGQTLNTQIVNSQVADELLTIKGIEASFVAGRDEKGETVVSARSLGNINVQVIMEHFGGGGHMNTAGLRTELSPGEILEQIERYMHENNTIGG